MTVNNPSSSQARLSDYGDYFTTSIYADARDGSNLIQTGVTYALYHDAPPSCSYTTSRRLYYFTEVQVNGVYYCYDNGDATFGTSKHSSVIRGSIDGNWYAYRSDPGQPGQPTGTVTNWSACSGDACRIATFAEEAYFRFGEWYAKFAGHTPWQWWNGNVWQDVLIQNYDFRKTSDGHWSDPMGPIPGGIWHFHYLYQPPTSINHFELDSVGDTYVDEGAPASNFGSSTEIRVNRTLRQSAAGPPVNVDPPTAGGVYVPGGTLVAHPGTWTGAEPITFNYLWSWCDGGELDNWCYPSPGEKYKIIDPLYDARMRNLRLNARATNAGGSVTKLTVLPLVGSPQTPPVSVEQPKLLGTPEVGRMLEATEGLWYAPTSTQFTFRWFSCFYPGTTACVERAGIGGQYLIAEADAGRMIRADVLVSPGSSAPVTVSTAYKTVAAVPPPPVIRMDGLVKFDYAPIFAPLVSATLELCALSTSPVGGDISVSQDVSWDESTVTWDTAPTGSPGSVSIGPVEAGQCYEIDVTDLAWACFLGYPGGCTFRISSPGPIEARYASKEASSGAPRLVIDTEY